MNDERSVIWGLDSGWDSSFSTEQRVVHPGGIFCLTPVDQTRPWQLELTNENTDGRFSSINQAFLLLDDGTVRIYEKGIEVSAPRP